MAQARQRLALLAERYDSQSQNPIIVAIVKAYFQIEAFDDLRSRMQQRPITTP